MAAPSQPRVFLSYSRRDMAFAEVLRERLQEHELHVWQDRIAMQSGDWRTQIWAAIEQAEHLVIVLTKDAIASPVVQEEWHYARKSGKEVSPVLADASLSHSDLPPWMRSDHIYKFDVSSPTFDSAHDFKRLVAVLTGPSLQRRMPTIARTAGEHFIPRPGEMDALRSLLLNSGGQAVGITTAFVGSGGMGKTTLALALAHDPRVQLGFHHGQIFIELGQSPALIQALAGATAALTGQPSMAGDVNTAARELSDAIGQRRILMVIDDVWDRAHLAPFLQGGANCARLVTTRDESLLPRGTQGSGMVHVDQMSPAQAVALIAADLPVEHVEAARHELSDFARQLGWCALLLELANGVLFSLHQDGLPLRDALADARLRFAKAGVKAFDIGNASARADAYARTIEASLSLLDEQERSCFLSLAIFPEDVDVPWSVIGGLWAASAGRSPEQSNELLTRLTRKSLLKRPERKEAGPAARLHDVVRQYLRDQFRADPARLADLNGALVDSFAAATPSRDEPGLRYYLARLPWHANEAGRRAFLADLLVNPVWMQAKLDGLNGLLPLIEDYDQFAQAPLERAVGRTVRLAAGAIARDPRQLFPQLQGRLPHLDAGGGNFWRNPEQPCPGRPWFRGTRALPRLMSSCSGSRDTPSASERLWRCRTVASSQAPTTPRYVSGTCGPASRRGAWSAIPPGCARCACCLAGSLLPLRMTSKHQVDRTRAFDCGIRIAAGK